MVTNSIKSSITDFGVKIQSPEIDKKDIVGNAAAFKTYIDAILGIYTTGLHTSVSIAEALSELSQELAGVEIVTKSIEELEIAEELGTAESIEPEEEIESGEGQKPPLKIESIEKVESPKK